LLYFALVKCVSLGISFADIERNLDNRALKIKRRAGDAKPGKLEEQIERLSKKRKLDSDVQPQFNSSNSSRIQMQWLLLFYLFIYLFYSILFII